MQKERSNIMSRLNKTQVYAIRWLNYEGKSPESISTELDITIKQVLSTLEKYAASVDDKKESKLDTKKEPVSTSKNLMINQTSSKQTKNVMIMTKEASAMNDELKKRYVSGPSRNSQDAIFRPNPNK
jgi:hypothetical protein